MRTSLFSAAELQNIHKDCSLREIQATLDSMEAAGFVEKRTGKAQTFYSMTDKGLRELAALL